MKDQDVPSSSSQTGQQSSKKSFFRSFLTKTVATSPKSKKKLGFDQPLYEKSQQDIGIVIETGHGDQDNRTQRGHKTRQNETVPVIEQLSLITSSSHQHGQISRGSKDLPVTANESNVNVKRAKHNLSRKKSFKSGRRETEGLQQSKSKSKKTINDKTDVSRPQERVKNSQSHRTTSSKGPSLQLATNNRSFQSRKRLSPFESPSKKLNKKLFNLVTDLRKTCDNYRKELRRAKEGNVSELLHLQQENETLNQEVYQLHSHVEKYKDRCRNQEKKGSQLVQIKSLNKENREMNEDIEVLKSVIGRLNNEMNRYQNKLKLHKEFFHGHLDKQDTSSSQSESLREEFENVLDKPRALFTLLQAYDEVIQEKNDIILTHEHSMDTFKSKCKEIIQDNKELHEIIADRSEKGTVSLAEWQVLHSNSLIVLEENDLLQEQLSILREKRETIIKSHQDKETKLQLKIKRLEEDRGLLKSAACKTEEHCKILIEQHTKLAEILEKRIPIEQHEASIHEIKKLFEDLKINYSDERCVLMDKLSSAEKERDRLINELTDLEVQNGKLHANLKTCEDALHTSAMQLKEVYQQISEANNSKDSTNQAMQDMMSLSQRVINERDNIERLLQEQRSSYEKLMMMRDRECELVSDLQVKIQAIERVHNQELEKFKRRIRELENIIEEMSARQKEELLHFEEIVESKTKLIEHLGTEKKQLKSDLETVWKTTTNTFKNMNKSKTGNQDEH